MIFAKGELGIAPKSDRSYFRLLIMPTLQLSLLFVVWEYLACFPNIETHISLTTAY